MRATILAIALAIGLLAAASFALIWSMTTAGEIVTLLPVQSADAPDDPRPALPPGAAAPAVPEPSRSRATRPVEPPAAAVRRRSARHAAAAARAARAQRLPNVWDLLRARVAPCLVRGGPRAVPVTARPRPEEASVLLLDVELRGGELEVIDVSSRDGGGAGDPVVSCAQEALRGQRLGAVGDREDDGTRVQLPFRLEP